MSNRHQALFCAMALAGVAPATHAQFVYDTTLGTYMNYDGDIDQGVFRMDDLDGNSFRVQRLDTETELGTYGVGGAALTLEAELFGFSDRGQSGFGPGDVATFQGIPGREFDFTLTDAFGETISGSIGLLELTDRSNSPVLPGVEGQARLSDLSFSGDSFQQLPLNANLTSGTFYIFIETTAAWGTLGELLAQGGAGPQLTLEIRLVPAPASLALLGTAGLIVRRRR